MNIKKKIKLTILLCLTLIVIGLAVFFTKQYLNSNFVLNTKYVKEVKDAVKLVGNQVVLKAIKEDLTNDSIADYLFLIGEEKVVGKEKVDGNVGTIVKTYSNVNLVYVNGSNKQVSNYKTNKYISSDYTFDVKKVGASIYILIFDSKTGNVIITNLVEEKFSDIVANTTDTDFNGYTFTSYWDSTDTTKCKVKLDNYKRSYLVENKTEYILDFKDTEVNKDNYRESYLANKFCEFNIKDENQDGILEAVGVQYILYLNKDIETIMKTAGRVVTSFNIENDKLVYKDTQVLI